MLVWAGILSNSALATAAPEMRAGEWEISPPGERYCFADRSPLDVMPSSLQGCSALRVKETAGAFTYSTICSMFGIDAAVDGTVTLDGPDAFTNVTHVAIADPASETSVITTIRRIGPCKPGDSPPPG